MKAGLRVILLPLALLTPRCASPVASLENLQDLHREDPDAPEGVVTFKMVDVIRHRGRCHRAWNSIRSFFWLDPIVETRDIEDPIKFSLYQLEVVLDDRDEFDDWGRLQAMLVLAELVRRSPSRAVQAECLRVLQVSVEDAGMAGVARAVGEPIEDEAWAEYEALVRALTKLATAEPELAARMLEQEGEAIATAARVLAEVQSVDPLRTQRMAQVAILVGRSAGEHPAAADLARLAEAQVARSLFLAAALGCRPTSAERVLMQAEAARLLIAMDPIAASRFLGPLLDRWIHQPGKVAVLQQLTLSRPDPARLDPDFRRDLVVGLFEPDAAWRHWSVRALTTMLELPEDTDRRELSSRWSSLGGVSVPEGP